MLLPATVAAQQDAPRFDRLTTDGGLSHSTVWSILQDSRSFLWIGTSDGLNRYDEDGASIERIIGPPAWKSWWAYSLYALIFMAYLWLYLRSQQRKFEEERAVTLKLRQADKEKDALICELEDKNAELERFTYTVSHDLKTPLVTIKGFLGMASRDMTDGDGELLEHDLERIGQAADRMARLLDELLEYSRIGRVVYASERVALGELAHEVAELQAPALAERGIELEISPDLPVVTGDRLRLSEVLQNLLENAIKFIGESKAPRIAITRRRDGAEEVVCVADNGRGISPRYHEKIFLLFERLAQDEEGTGIGLALVKRIVEDHGGRIWVESEGEGRGSRFCFTIPGDRPSPELGA